MQEELIAFGAMSDREILISMYKDIQSLNRLKDDVDSLKTWHATVSGALAVVMLGFEFVAHKFIGSK